MLSYKHILGRRQDQMVTKEMRQTRNRTPRGRETREGDMAGLMKPIFVFISWTKHPEAQRMEKWRRVDVRINGLGVECHGGQ